MNYLRTWCFQFLAGWLTEVGCWMFLFLTHFLGLILFLSWYFLLLCFYSNARTWYGSLYMHQVGGDIEQLSVFWLIVSCQFNWFYLGSNTPIPSLFQLQKQLLHYCACLSICQINATKVVQSCPTKMRQLCFEKTEIFLWLEGVCQFSAIAFYRPLSLILVLDLICQQNNNSKLYSKENSLFFKYIHYPLSEGTHT